MLSPPICEIKHFQNCYKFATCSEKTSKWPSKHFWRKTQTMTFSVVRWWKRPKIECVHGYCIVTYFLTTVHCESGLMGLLVTLMSQVTKSRRLWKTIDWRQTWEINSTFELVKVPRKQIEWHKHKYYYTFSFPCARSFMQNKNMIKTRLIRSFGKTEFASEKQQLRPLLHPDCLQKIMWSCVYTYARYLELSPPLQADLLSLDE